VSTVLGEQGLPEARSRWAPWLAIAVGLALLYAPTYVSLSRDLWRDDAYAHGPVILAIFAWLVWRGRAALLDETRPAILPGLVLLAAGLVLYVGGRALGFMVFEVASHLPVLAGIVLLMRGRRGLARLGFAIAFLAFLVPLPGFVLDAATTPLKSLVSGAVEIVLRAAGYPVERSGVVLALGDHQLLVADACSGMNSLVSFFALGLLYVHLVRPSRWRAAALLVSIVPIAIAANVLRVTCLVLVTYHFGEDAAQSFLHGLAGLVAFLSALAMWFGLDGVLAKKDRGQTTCSEWKNKPDPAGHKSDPPAATFSSIRNMWSVPGLVPGLVLLIATAAAAAVPALKPVAVSNPIDLESVVPREFGDWRIDPQTAPIAPAPDVQAKLDRIYRQVVSRTYVNGAGERVMLTIAHGGDQSDALKAHRQEACYAAQGFDIHGLERGELDVAGRSIPVTRMVATRGDRVEPVTYWFTMGERVVLGRGERLRVQVENGLAGRIPDGMLVRVSTLTPDAAHAFTAQQAFVGALFAGLAERDAARFVGSRG